MDETGEQEFIARDEDMENAETAERNIIEKPALRMLQALSKRCKGFTYMGICSDMVDNARKTRDRQRGRWYLQKTPVVMAFSTIDQW